MTKNGIEFTDKIDLVTEGDDFVNLVIVQTNDFTDDLLQSFQEKLNNYLTFGLDGQLHKLYPGTESKKIQITMDIYSDISGSALAILERAQDAVKSHGVEFYWDTKELDG